MICSCYNIDSERPIAQQNQVQGGGLWGISSNVWWWDDKIKPIALHGMRKTVVDGKATWFWEDVWLSDKPLMELFPRLYSTSTQQRKPIS